ncbi:MAG: hypothetical protein H8F28_11145 [Fibrella sp.]|nr:hypothetical protein [Armatimonadota bacterium]
MNINHVSPNYIQSSITRAALAVGFGLTALSIPLTVTVLTESPVRAQEADTVSTSQLSGGTVPAGAVRVRARQVPEEVTKALRTMMESAGDTVKQGRTELLVWETGKKGAKANDIKSQIGATLRRGNWEYTEGEPDAKIGPFTLVTALQTKPTRRALIGFWVPTEEALILAWTEMLPAKNEPSRAEAGKPADAEYSIGQIFKDLQPEHVVTPPVPEPYKTSASNSSPASVLSFTMTPNQYCINVMKSAMPPMPSFAKLALKPGVVRGYVKDSKERPLAGAVIGVRSSSAGGFYSGASAKSDARGYYEVAVPWGAASFYTATITQDYADGRASFGLHPADGEADSFATAGGLVENWVLLPYGVGDRDSASDQPQYSGNYYGGSLSVSYYIADPRFDGDKNLPDGSELEVTLSPEGKLFDGSTGKAIVVRRPVKESSRTSFYINNVPVGTYRISARLIGGNSPRSLHLKETGPYSSRPLGLDPKEGATTATLTFRPGGAKARMSPAARGNWDSLDVSVSL